MPFTQVFIILEIVTSINNDYIYMVEPITVNSLTENKVILLIIKRVHMDYNSTMPSLLMKSSIFTLDRGLVSMSAV